MAQISTIASTTRAVPKNKMIRQHRSITMDFSPTQFTADVTQGDNILLMTLPKDARINDSGVRVTGILGLTGSFITLRSTENLVSTNLTNPLSSTFSGSAVQNTAPPTCNITKVKTLELLVGGNSIDHNATGICEITVNYDFFKLTKDGIK